MSTYGEVIQYGTWEMGYRFDKEALNKDDHDNSKNYFIPKCALFTTWYLADMQQVILVHLQWSISVKCKRPYSITITDYMEGAIQRQFYSIIRKLLLKMAKQTFKE